MNDRRVQALFEAIRATQQLNNVETFQQVGFRTVRGNAALPHSSPQLLICPTLVIFLGGKLCTASGARTSARGCDVHD